MQTVLPPRRSLLKKTGDAANASRVNNRRLNQSTVNSTYMNSKIKNFRLALMLTQQEFADLHGVSQKLIAAIENGTREQHFDVEYKLTPQNSVHLLHQVQFFRLFRESGLTQLDFAVKVGVIRADISKYLAQKKVITTKRWLRIVERLGVDVTPTEGDWEGVWVLFGRRTK